MPVATPYPKRKNKLDHMNFRLLQLPISLCLLLCALLCIPKAVAQVPRSSKILNNNIAQRAEQLLQHHLPLFDSPLLDGSQLELTNLEQFLNTKLFQTELLKDNWYSSKISQLKSQTGVQFGASYQHNEYWSFDDTFENDARFRVGLDFDLLENGLIQKSVTLKRLRKDQEIHQKESVLNSRNRDYAFLYNCLIYNFNREKIALLQERIPFLQEYVRLLYELYFAHEMSYDQIIDQKSRLKEAEIMLAAAEQFNEALQQEIGGENIALLATDQLPVVQIEVEQLLDPSDMNEYQQALRQLKNERIDLTHNKRMEARLNVFARYNYGSIRTSTSGQQDFTSFGMTFRTPIQFKRKFSSEMAQYEKAMVDEEISEVWYNRVKEIMIYYEEYQYKLKQYSNFLHKVFRLEEKLRVEKVLIDSRQDIHSPMKAIRHLDNNQAVNYELLHLKQQLYLLLLKIHLRAFQNEFTRCLIPLDFSDEHKKLKGQRFVKLGTSNDFQLDPEYLIKYLQKNEIDQVLIDQSSGTAKQWMEILHAEGFEIFCSENTQTSLPTNLQTSLSGQYRKLNTSGQLMLSSVDGIGGQSQIQLTKVPDQIFENRNELERWIQLESQTSGTEYFLFEDIHRIMELDKKNLGVE